MSLFTRIWQKPRTNCYPLTRPVSRIQKRSLAQQLRAARCTRRRVSSYVFFAGTLAGRNLAEIQGKLQAESAATGAAIAGLSFCPHLPDAGCECRKPAPGMLLNIAKRLDIDLAEVPFIGDKLSDILAAKAAGARPMLVLTGQGKEDVKNPGFPSDVPVYQDLAEAADQLLSAH